MRLLLLLLVSKITHIYFSFFIRARYACLFLSSHGSSLIGLPFPPFRDVCNILSPTMRSEIFACLSSSIAVADGRVLVV